MSASAQALESLLSFWSDAGVETQSLDHSLDRTDAAALAAALKRLESRSRPGEAPSSAARSAAASEPRHATPPPASPAERAARAVIDAREAAAKAAAGSDSLEALEAAIAAFEGCPLKAGARRAVFSRGDAAGGLMLIGEAPGADEDLKGEPFVGRAGKLLDRMLTAAGLLEHAFITNTVFWRPPGNRTPTADEQAVCAPFVERAIALARPKLLVFVGGAAAKAMLARPEGILTLRGRWLEWKSSDGAVELPVMPTLHPSFLLRQPAAKRKAWEDWLLIAERFDRHHRPAH